MFANECEMVVSRDSIFAGERRLVLAGKVADWEGEDGRVGGEKTGRTDVPGNGSGEDTSCATGGLQVLCSGHLSRGCAEVVDEEEKEGDVEEEEEGDETDRGAEGGDKHNECEDEPAGEVDAERAVEFSASDGSLNVEPGDENDGERPPEGAVRAESSGTWKNSKRKFRQCMRVRVYAGPKCAYRKCYRRQTPKHRQ